MGGLGYQTPTRTVKGEHVDPRIRRQLLAASILALTPILTGCGLANSTPSRSGGGQAPPQANPGEHEGTISAADARQAAPLDPAASPQLAVERFANAYINWTWRTLPADQERLAASAVGEARAAELQARQQTARDTPLARGRIYNTGQIVGVTTVRGGATGEWVAVTREQTGGEGEYAELRPTLHVTLATVRRVPGGFAVSSWQPGL